MKWVKGPSGIQYLCNSNSIFSILGSVNSFKFHWAFHAHYFLISGIAVCAENSSTTMPSTTTPTSKLELFSVLFVFTVWKVTMPICYLVDGVSKNRIYQNKFFITFLLFFFSDYSFFFVSLLKNIKVRYLFFRSFIYKKFSRNNFLRGQPQN